MKENRISSFPTTYSSHSTWILGTNILFSWHLTSLCLMMFCVTEYVTCRVTGPGCHDVTSHEMRDTLETVTDVRGWVTMSLFVNTRKVHHMLYCVRLRSDIGNNSVMSVPHMSCQEYHHISVSTTCFSEWPFASVRGLGEEETSSYCVSSSRADWCPMKARRKGQDPT